MISESTGAMLDTVLFKSPVTFDGGVVLSEFQIIILFVIFISVIISAVASVCAAIWSREVLNHKEFERMYK